MGKSGARVNCRQFGALIADTRVCTIRARIRDKKSVLRKGRLIKGYSVLASTLDSAKPLIMIDVRLQDVAMIVKRSDSAVFVLCLDIEILNHVRLEREVLFQGMATWSMTTSRSRGASEKKVLIEQSLDWFLDLMTMLSRAETGVVKSLASRRENQVDEDGRST